MNDSYSGGLPIKPIPQNQCLDSIAFDPEPVNNQTPSSLSSSSSSSSQPEVSLYENMLQEIRDMKVLSSYQIYYLRGLSKKKLLRMIELYNVILRNVNEII